MICAKLFLKKLSFILGPQGKTCNKDLVMSGTKWPSNDTTDLTVWAPLTCPLENECLNHRHNCETNQDCIDLPDGFMCRCKIGYEIDPRLVLIWCFKTVSKFDPIYSLTRVKRLTLENLFGI